MKQKKSISIVSWNVNGIRACVKKGFLDYLKTHEPDILCLQESKARKEDLEDHIFSPPGYHGIWHHAEKKGYSGTAILTKLKPTLVLEGFGNPSYDCEGRVVVAEYGDTVVMSVYFPNGQMNEDRLHYKLSFYHDFFDYCRILREDGKKLIICGDYNTAHQEIDLARPKENETTSGFLPIEREWLDRIIADGYVDTFRHFHPEPDQYSWWSYRTRARERNIGWRIDYCLVSEDLVPQLEDAFIQPNVMGSDHCPVGVRLTF